MSMSFVPSRTVLSTLVGLALLTTPVVAAPGAWTTDFEAAKKKAASTDKDLLLEFTGSDWCPPCKKLKKKVFESKVFKQRAPEHFVLVKLDFPRDKSDQPKEVTRQNERLRKRFDISAYPTILLADAQARPYAMKEGYGGTDAKPYTKELIQSRQKRQVRDKHLAAAKKAKGLKKAKLLDKALDGISPALIAKSYTEQAKRIVALDSENAAGLKAKYQSILQLPKVKKRLEKIKRKAARDGAAAALKQVHMILQEMKPKGVALQEVKYIQALLNYKAGDKQKATRLLQTAREAAPESSKGERIRKILQRLKQRQ